jgi:hypothetical protein
VDRYQRIGAHGEMISSDLHGAEEPIRWLLGWQRQDRVVTSPCTEKKKDALIRTFWQRPSLWGSTPYRWDIDLDDQDATRVAWTISGACGSVLGFFGTCGRLQEPQEGQRLAQWMMIMPQQGQRLPFRGLTSHY